MHCVGFFLFSFLAFLSLRMSSHLPLSLPNTPGREEPRHNHSHAIPSAGPEAAIPAQKELGQVAEGERRLMEPRGPSGAPGLEPALSRAVLEGSSGNGFGTSAGSSPISLRLDFGGLVT